MSIEAVPVSLHVEHDSTSIPVFLGGLPYLGDYSRLAEAISRTEMVPRDLRGRSDAVLAVMMFGFELGVGPMQCLQSINMIQGRPSQSSELMRARITQRGHAFRVDATDEVATVRYRRREWAPDEPTAVVTFTLDDARKAGLIEWYERWRKTERGGNVKDTWNPHGPHPKPEWVDTEKATHRYGDNYFAHPRSMLIARATSEAARAGFADVLSGLSYTPDEVMEFEPAPVGLSAPGTVVLPVTSEALITGDQLTALRAVLAAIEDPAQATAAKIAWKERFGAPDQLPASRYAEGIAYAHELATPSAPAVTETPAPESAPLPDPTEPEPEPEAEAVTPVKRDRYGQQIVSAEELAALSAALDALPASVVESCKAELRRTFGDPSKMTSESCAVATSMAREWPIPESVQPGPAKQPERSDVRALRAFGRTAGLDEEALMALACLHRGDDELLPLDRLSKSQVMSVQTLIEEVRAGRVVVDASFDGPRARRLESVPQ